MFGNPELLWLLWTIRAVSAITLTISPPIVVHDSDLPAKTTFECANITAEGIKFIFRIQLSKLSNFGSKQRFAAHTSGADPAFTTNTAPITLKKPTAAVVSGGIDSNTPNKSTLKVEFQTNEMTCEDAGTYTCSVMYMKTSYNTVENSQQFSVYALPSNVTIEASKDGVINSTLDYPFQMEVGENITLTCSGQMGNDNSTSLWWRMTSPTTGLFNMNQSANMHDTGTATLQSCCASRTATLSYTATIEDSNRTNLPAFMCSASFQPPGHPLNYTVDSGAFYISVLRPTLTCGHPGYLTQDNGTIDTHVGFATNQDYGNDLNCTWTIQAPVGMFIQLTAESFDLEQRSPCDHDYLEIFDGDGTSDRSMGIYCDTTMKTMESSQNYLTLHFVTDSGTPKKGFRLRYTFTNSSNSHRDTTSGFGTIGVPVIATGAAVTLTAAVVYVAWRVRIRWTRQRSPPDTSDSLKLKRPPSNGVDVQTETKSTQDTLEVIIPPTTSTTETDNKLRTPPQGSLKPNSLPEASMAMTDFNASMTRPGSKIPNILPETSISTPDNNSSYSRHSPCMQMKNTMLVSLICLSGEATKCIGELPDNLLLELSEDLISLEWQFFFRFLIDSRHNPDRLISQVTLDYPNVKERIYQLLVKWRNLENENATLDAIVRALKDYNRPDLVDKYQKMKKSTTVHSDDIKTHHF